MKEKLNFKNYNDEWESRCQFNYEQIESQHHSLDESLYPMLHPEALYTSFADYYQLFSELPLSVNRVADLGAGVGKLAPIWKSIRESGEVSLVEMVKSRMDAARSMVERLELKDIHITENDLLESSIPSADAYFIYLPEGKVLEKIIHELSQRKKPFWIITIESHGNLFDRLDSWKGLSLKKQIPLFSPRHNPLGRIYYYEPFFLEVSLFEKALASSFLPRVMIIQEPQGQWLGHTEDLLWGNSEELILKYPPRTVKKESIVDIRELGSFSEEVQTYLKLMRREEIFDGSIIRKIWISPELKIEFQNGKITKKPFSE